MCFADVNVTSGSVSGSTANIVYIDMVPGRVGEVGLANNSVVSTEPVGDIIKKQGNRHNLLASVNGGYFNAYYSGNGMEFPNNCPRLYATVMEEGELINGGGNTQLPTLGFTKDGTAIMDLVALTPYVYVDGGQSFSTWGVNSFYTDASAIMHFTDEMTLTVPLTRDMKMAVIENGVVTEVSNGRSINLSQGMDVLAFNSSAYANPPAVGSKVEFKVKRTPKRSEDQAIWDKAGSAISVGPMLVNNSKNVSRENESFKEANQQPDVNTLKGFVGVMRDGRVIMGNVTATNIALADYLVSICCTDAVCLDGGASTVLYTTSKGFIRPGGRNFANVLSIVDKYEIPVAENIYDGLNDAELTFDTNRLNTVVDTNTATMLMKSVVNGMNSDEISSAKAKDQLAYLAEEASARSATLEVEDDIVLSNDTISQATEAVNNVKNSV